VWCRDGDDEAGGSEALRVTEPPVQGRLLQQQQLRQRVQDGELASAGPRASSASASARGSASARRSRRSSDCHRRMLVLAADFRSLSLFMLSLFRLFSSLVYCTVC
jgi:hypothetical protein